MLKIIKNILFKKDKEKELRKETIVDRICYLISEDKFIACGPIGFQSPITVAENPRSFYCRDGELSLSYSIEGWTQLIAKVYVNYKLYPTTSIDNTRIIDSWSARREKLNKKIRDNLNQLLKNKLENK